MRVVFGDDSFPMRERLRAWLQNCGQEVVAEAVSARETYAKVKEFRPDLAVLDIMMPPEDGATIAVKIAAERLAGHVMVVTSNSQKALTGHFASLGISLRTKPLDEQQFATMVKAIEKKLECQQQPPVTPTTPTEAA